MKSKQDERSIISKVVVFLPAAVRPTGHGVIVVVVAVVVGGGTFIDSRRNLRWR